VKLILDTSVVLNYASAERLDLLRSVDMELFVGAEAQAELAYWPRLTPKDGQDFVLGDELPTARPLELTNSELETFARLRNHGLGLGECESGAIAESRGMIFATDDWNARTIIEAELPRLQLSSTIRILEYLVGLGALPGAEAEEVAALMRRRGRRLPDRGLKSVDRVTDQGEWPVVKVIEQGRPVAQSETPAVHVETSPAPSKTPDVQSKTPKGFEGLAKSLPKGLGGRKAGRKRNRTR
jgi:predicted nucleic acid-binding protein